MLPERIGRSSDTPPNLLEADLPTALAAWGEPRYRAEQVARWLYREQVFEPAAMRDLPRPLRERLAAEFPAFPVTLEAERTADAGLTSKALLRLADGRRVESVLMRYPDGSN